MSGEKATKPADPTKANQIFMYRSTDSNGANPYDFNTPVTSDLPLYAQWADICTVTFTNGTCYYRQNSTYSATCTFYDSSFTVDVACGTTVRRPEDPSSPKTMRINNQNRTVYFSKWSTESAPGYNDTSNNFDFNNTPINESRTLYAIGYSSNNTSYYTVTFSANGGTLNGPSSVQV